MNLPAQLIFRHLFLWVCVALLPSMAGASGKIALVIGNAQYERASSLANPGNDADDMTAALTELGFAVFGGQDMSQDMMLAQIAAFEEQIVESKVALFYYAGHAIQVGGKNYLLPVDVVPTSAQAVLDASIPLDRALAAMEKAPGLRLVLLDSCRDNPLGIEELAQEDGLARVGSAANYMITYATQPGAKAFDGEGRKVFEDIQKAIAPLGIKMEDGPTTGGPDIIPLANAGVPAFRLQQDGTDYFDLHHTPDDTFDKIDKDSVAQNVAAWAATVWMASEADVDYRAKPEVEAAAEDTGEE